MKNQGTVSSKFPQQQLNISTKDNELAEILGIELRSLLLTNYQRPSRGLK
jgi:hypothetical protein